MDAQGTLTAAARGCRVITTSAAIPLGQLGTFRNGVNFNRHQEGEGLPVLKVKDFGSLTVSPTSGLDELDPSKIAVPDDQILAEGDTVIIRSNGNPALVGRSLFFPGSRHRITFSGFCIRFRPDRSRVDPRFIAYYVRSPLARSMFTAFGAGTGIQNLSQGVLAALPVPLPPLPEQRVVAEILGALDDKIDLNRRMNATLEALAAAIFKAWFVDFEPVKARAAGRRSFPGMPQDVFDSLPDTFESSALGPVPKGWRCSTLGEECAFVMGQSPPSETYNQSQEGLPFHQGVGTFGERFPLHQTFCTVANRLAETGDVLFSVRAPVGRINVADRQLIVGRGLAAIRHHHGRQSFLLYHLKHAFQVEDSIGTGTIFAAVTKSDMARIPLLRPDVVTAEAFERITAPLDALIESNTTETATLSATRDLLLPRLLGGTLRSNAEVPVE